MNNKYKKPNIEIEVIHIEDIMDVSNPLTDGGVGGDIGDQGGEEFVW